MLSGIVAGTPFSTDMIHSLDNLKTPADAGAFLIVMDPSKVISMEDYFARTARFVEFVKSSETWQEGAQVFLPGEIEVRKYGKALTEFVHIILRYIIRVYFTLLCIIAQNLLYVHTSPLLYAICQTCVTPQPYSKYINHGKVPRDNLSRGTPKRMLLFHRGCRVTERTCEVSPLDGELESYACAGMQTAV